MRRPSRLSMAEPLAGETRFPVLEPVVAKAVIQAPELGIKVLLGKCRSKYLLARPHYAIARQISRARF